ncbi:MAG: hypothetical protein NC401_19435 [Ruminococcus sp.]|nr:hypothetical protein [Ruminococcus sp.]
MKKIRITVIITMLAALLGGCYPSEQRTKPTETESVQSSVESPSDSPNGTNANSDQGVDSLGPDGNAIHFNTDNLLLDMSEPLGIPNSVSSLRLTLKKWNSEYMKKALLGDNSVTEEYEYDCQFYSGEKHYGYDTSDLSVFWEPGKFGYSDKSALGGEFKYGSVYYQVTDDFAANDEELSAFSRKDAINRVNEFLEKIGITNYGETKIAPIKAEFANEVLGEFKKRGENTGEAFDYTPWTAEEECYYLRCPLIYNNMELSVDMIDIPRREWAVNGTYIEAVVSKDKIIRVMGNDIYSENTEKADEVSINYNFEQAVEVLKDYYSKIAFDSPTTYYSCKLVYFPDDVSDDHMTVTFMPVWRFNGYYCYYFDETQPNKKRQQNQYFYADTGYRYIGLE